MDPRTQNLKYEIFEIYENILNFVKGFEEFKEYTKKLFNRIKEK